MTNVRRGKVVMLGQTGVGKSSILMRASHGVFLHTLGNTVGAAYLALTRHTSDGTKVDMEVWDTAGQERYDCLAPMYYRGSAVAVVVFDVADRSSFRRADLWCRTMTLDVPEARIVLVGNKADMIHARCVDDKDIKTLAHEYDASYIETSAQDNRNIEQLMQLIASTIVPPTPPLTPDSIESVPVPDAIPESPKGCGPSCRC